MQVHIGGRSLEALSKSKISQRLNFHWTQKLRRNMATSSHDLMASNCLEIVVGEVNKERLLLTWTNKSCNARVRKHE